ncbi:MAG: hypothetical protein RLZZ361_299, partial [Cyanobacteriota bacterium]
MSNITSDQEDLTNLEAERRRKLESLRSLNIDPYPYSFK